MTRVRGPAVYALTLEHGSDGSHLAWVDDVPGCAVRGGTRDDVLARAPAAIRAFLAWAGEPVPDEIEVVVGDVVEAEIAADEDTEALVGADRAPLTAEHWRRIAAWLERSRADALAALASLDEQALAGRRAGSERTIREELAHVAFVELMYAAWTFDLHSREGLAEFLPWTRAIAGERLRQLAEQRDDRLTHADWSGAPRLEPWTARKAARRLLWHELLHVRAIAGEVSADA
ncbi:MAG: DinB family protein [Thermoleophilia bacterium]|nr:DinB family protein [Thermoleophilia bacterium]